MKTTLHLFSFKAALPVILATGIFAATMNAAPPAKPTLDPSSHAAHVAAGTMPPDAPKGDPTISELQAKVAQLEASLAKAAPAGAMPPAGPMAVMAMPPAGPMAGMGTPPAGPMAGMASPGMGAAAAPAPAMAGMGGGMNMMGMMDKMMGMGGGAMPAGGAPMAPAAPGGMGGGMGMMDMDGMMGMMGSMSGKGATAGMSASALPGFPGATHLYHLGATGFFLDHKSHIALTTEQTAALNTAKEQARLAKSSADRTVAQAEQELWMLTAADQPDAAAVEAKIREIEKTRGDERLAFIRSVGEASKLLTDAQRKSLTGFAPPAPAAPMAPMKDM